MSKHPEVLWAQRSSSTVPEKNVVYLTINVPDIIGSTLEYVVNSTNLSFKAGTTGGTDYAFDLDLFADIDPDKSTQRLTLRSFAAVLRKKDSESEYWPRLTKEKIKTSYIKTDFSKWVDEDEQDGEKTGPDDEDALAGGGGFPGMSDFDLSKLGGDFGAGAGLGEDQSEVENADSDSDEGGPPPLEDTEPVN